MIIGKEPWYLKLRIDQYEKFIGLISHRLKDLGVTNEK